MRLFVQLPPHTNPGEQEPYARAPYNFVPLPEVAVAAVDDAENLPGHDSYAHERFPYTGYFDVILTTRSPLYVRCPITRQAFDRDEQEKDVHGRRVDAHTRYADRVKNTPHFFYTHTPQHPVIPGSSLRGMLRNLLEIVSHGKLTKVTDKRLVYRAVGDRTALGAWYREQTLGANRASLPDMHFDYPSPRLRGGYLCRYQGEWAIRPAKEHLGESFIHVEYSAARGVGIKEGGQTCHEVFVTPVRRTSTHRGRRGPGMLTLNLAVTTGIAQRLGIPPPGMVPAVVVESGHMGRSWGQPPVPHQKHMHCAIYEPDTAAKPIPIPRQMWDAYVEDRDMTRGISTRCLTDKDQPLFYLLDDKDNLVFFGSTMMFRLPYERSVHDLIPQQLRDPLLIDYADALFGFVRDPKDFPDQKALPPQGSKSRAYASRVFVTDATLTTQRAPQDIWLMEEQTRALTPHILATPKPTSFQHYLVQPETTRPHLSHYDSPQEDAEGQPRGHQTVIRGHKLYWHQGDKTAEELAAKYTGGDAMIRRQFVQDTNGQWKVKETSTQHTHFKPVKAGVEFTFRLYFENLSKAELGALCWILQPLGESHKEYCHSLGMGKPFGMGAVHLDATLYLTKHATRYTTLFNGDSWETGIVNIGERLSARLEQVTQLTEAFEQDILNKLKPLNGECHSLAALRRIGMLLTLMEWPTPLTQQETEYMMPSQFRDRPVLPDPAYDAQNFMAVAVPVAEHTESNSQAKGDSSSDISFPPPVPSQVPQRSRRKLEQIVLTTAVKNDKAQVRLEGGEIEFPCTKIPSYFQFKIGDRFQARVTYDGERPTSAVFDKRI